MWTAFSWIVLTTSARLIVVLASPSSDVHSILHRYQRQSSCKPKLDFSCSNGECIPSYNLCDGSKDCSDGSDETTTVCRAIPIRCSTLSFECAYGACIDRDLKCDGKSDCADGSDEQDCGPPPTSSNCGSQMFRCSDGQCIDQYSICDGLKDCSDGSDETATLCRPLKCPSSSFQCAYGACMEQGVKCNGQQDCPDGSDEWGCSTPSPPTYVTSPVPSGGCILPQHPQHGVYSSSLCQIGDARAACRNSPGTAVPNNWLLKYSCNANYDLTSSDSEFSVCDNGQWKNPLDCIKLCSPLQSLSVDVRCALNGREVSCDRPMKPNTTATARCRQHYQEAYKPQYASLLCRDNGEWNYRLFYCVPDCGISTKVEDSRLDKVVPLIVGGVPVVLGQFPWLAAIFLTEKGQWVQKCGGTLVSSHIVLTAAHCLVLDEGMVAPENIKVGLGKYYRDFNKYENYSVIADVRDIRTPKNYAGGASFYAVDIGLIDLKVSVQVTAYIMPACINWGSALVVNTGEVGHVAGWGTTENKTSSETVLSAQLSYIDNQDCIRRVRQVYKRFVTHDKFCAGSINGSQVDKGDSGGGLTVVRNEQHFVIGVVSTRITEETRFSLFTDIANAEHHTWLDEQRTILDNFHFET